MRENIKIVFMGTPEFARESLKGLVEAKFNVIACFTNPDKPSGRGMKLKSSPVKEYATQNNIEVYQPKKIRKNQEVIQILKDLNPDVIAVVAYGKILPEEILSIPKYGCINVHGSLLPKYRGAAPMQWAIINGEKKTGITTMFMDKGMDTGDMLLKEEIEIKESDNLESIHNTLMVIGAKLLVETIDKVVAGKIERVKQPEEGTIAPMITREMTKIDFSKSPRDIFNFVRGLSPFPGTYIQTQSGTRFKVFDVDYVENDTKGTTYGQIVKMSKTELEISCKGGSVLIKEIQPENSKRMSIQAFMNSNRLKSTDSFV